MSKARKMSDPSEITQVLLNQMAAGQLSRRRFLMAARIALRRMENADAIITTMDQIVSELAIDWTTPNGQKLSGILAYH